ALDGGGRRRGSGLTHGRVPQRPADGLGARHYGAADVSVAQAGCNLLTDDAARFEVGEVAFQPPPHFDADLVLVPDDEQKDAVVLALLADAPSPGQVDRVVLE